MPTVRKGAAVVLGHQEVVEEATKLTLEGYLRLAMLTLEQSEKELDTDPTE